MLRRNLWISFGSGLCLTAALVVQRAWGQPGAVTLPDLPPPVVSTPSLPVPPPPVGNPTTPPVTTTPIAPPAVGGPVALPPVTPPGAPPVTLPVETAPPVQIVPVAPPAAQNLPNLPTTPNAPLVPAIPTTTINTFRAPDLGNSETRPGKQEPSISIEWIAPANARFNQPTACQILVRNSGSSPVHQVVVKPNLPDQVKVKSSEPPIDPNNNDWSLGTLQPGQMKKIEVTILSQRRGYQNYTAHVTFAANTVHLTEVREPLLQIKMKGPEKTMVGEQTPITFTVHNPGDGNTENIKVRAILPDGLEHPRGQAFEIEVGNLSPKETRTLQLACTAKGPG
jgi:hypothetical protein